MPNQTYSDDFSHKNPRQSNVTHVFVSILGTENSTVENIIWKKFSFCLFLRKVRFHLVHNQNVSQGFLRCFTTNVSPFHPIQILRGLPIFKPMDKNFPGRIFPEFIFLDRNFLPPVYFGRHKRPAQNTAESLLLEFSSPSG